jgi:hypothetical protein
MSSILHRITQNLNSITFKKKKTNNLNLDKFFLFTKRHI